MYEDKNRSVLKCRQNYWNGQTWDKNISGKKLNHLRYANNVVIVGPNFEELQAMLTELAEKFEKNCSKNELQQNKNNDKHT